MFFFGPVWQIFARPHTKDTVKSKMPKSATKVRRRERRRNRQRLKKKLGQLVNEQIMHMLDFSESNTEAFDKMWAAGEEADRVRKELGLPSKIHRFAPSTAKPPNRCLQAAKRATELVVDGRFMLLVTLLTACVSLSADANLAI
jgi:hypothetical protein